MHAQAIRDKVTGECEICFRDIYKQDVFDILRARAEMHLRVYGHPKVRTLAGVTFRHQ